MKRTLIALGVIAAAAAPLAAQAAPTVYGKLNLALEKVDAETSAGVVINDAWNVSSYASRFGVKGEDTLTPSLSVVYGIEWQVEGDGVAADLGQRNRFVGLKHSDFGTLKLGKLDTNLKNVQGKIDLFNDTQADISSGNYGAGAIFSGETRANNVIGYESPKIAGAVNVNLQLIPGEDAAGGTYNGLTDGISASVAYDKDGLYLALGYDKEVAGNLALTASPAGRRDTIRLAGSYKLSDLTLGALYSISEPVSPAAGTADEETAYLLSAAYKLDSWTLKAQYSAAENDGAAATVERTRYALGADYALGSKTKAYGYYTTYEQDGGNESTVLAIGLDHSF